MSDTITLSSLDRSHYAKELTRDYLDYIKKTPNKTPGQLIDTIYFGRRSWFDSLSSEDLDYFNKVFEDFNAGLDVDPEWNVSVANQKKASLVFNGFLKQMRGISLGDRKNVELTTVTLSEEFNRVFKTGTGAYSLLRAFSSNSQLKDIGKRVTKELLKLGYKL